MERRKKTGTVAEWLIEEELADYTRARFFLEDTVKEFVQDMEKFQYSLNLLYEAQKNLPSDLLRSIQSLRSGIPTIQNLHISIFMPRPPKPIDMPSQQNIPPIIKPPTAHIFQ